MRIGVVLTNVCNRLRAFRGDKRGNVLITFALALVPIIGFVGAAVDYSRGNSTKAAMQSAVDSTALMLSKEAQSLTTAQLNAKADAIFRALFHRPDVTNLMVTPKFVDPGTGNYKLTLTAQGAVPTTFTRVIGQDHINVDVSSQVVWGVTKMEIALALDVTGSMASDDKMTKLKEAAKNLLTTLKKAAKKADDTKVAIVPFAVVVNAGAANVNADWLDWSDWMSEPAILAAKPTNWDRVGPGVTCPFTDANHGFRCTNGPGSRSNETIVSTIPTSGTYAGLICPSKDNGAKDTASTGLLNNRYYSGCYTSTEKPSANWYTVASGSNASCGSTPNCSCSGGGSNKVCKQKTYTHVWRPSPKTAWDGCVRDRNQPFDAEKTAPTFVGTTVTVTNLNGQQENYRIATTPSTAEAFQPFQYATCPAALQPLTDVYAQSGLTTLETKINELSPNGNTNVTIGLSWAHHALTAGTPLSTAGVPSDGLMKVIILLTDGDNTQNRWTTNGTDIDARTQQACAKVKASGIELWTIRVINGNAKLLQACATEIGKYKNVQDASELNKVFDEIAKNLTKLRIAM